MVYLNIKLKGKVVSGSGRGKLLGFPTANLELTESAEWPDFGVYAGLATVRGSKYKAAVSCGPAYTFEETKPKLEILLFDYNNEIYGEEIELVLIAKVSEMEKYSNTKELIKKIEKDCHQVLLVLENF